MPPTSSPLFIFEMSNNHQGSLEHGLRIIDAMNECAEPYKSKFSFAFKFQYRHLDTFIHPNMRGRSDIKHLQRFESTRLSESEFSMLLRHVKTSGLLAICTPFDEKSAYRIKDEGYHFLKIASCSFEDWPLLESIAKTKMPVIASVASVDLETIKEVCTFFDVYKTRVALMHCVAEYPTPIKNLNLNQIDLLKKNFPNIPIGFSTHESPDMYDTIKIAIAKGATIFEKHVGVPTKSVTLNEYSANPEQVSKWLEAANLTFTLCGQTEGRYISSEKEIADLSSLKRGVFAKKNLQVGCPINASTCYFAFPCQSGQLLAEGIKSDRLTLNEPIEKDSPVMLSNL